ncbi:MAG: ATP-binding protein [Steroidobacteraceae bacterium]
MNRFGNPVPAAHRIAAGHGLRTTLVVALFSGLPAGIPAADAPTRPTAETVLAAMLTNDLPAAALMTLARESRAAIAGGNAKALPASLIASLECRGLYRLARLDDAMAACERALQSAKTDAEQFAALRMQGALLTEQGQLSAGTTALLESLAAAERNGDPRLIASALGSAGTAAQFAGAYTEAVEYYEQAIDVANQAQLHSLQALIGSNLGYLMLDTSNANGAQAQFEAALAAARAAGHEQAVLTSSWGLAAAKLAAGQSEAALADMESLAMASPPTADPVQRGEALQLLARARLANGQTDAAITDAQRAVDALQGRGEMRVLAASVLLVEALAAAGRNGEGLALARQTLDRMPPGARLSADLHETHAAILSALGRHRDAYQALLQSRRIRQQQSNARAAERLTFMRRREAQQRDREIDLLLAERRQREDAARSDRIIRNLSVTLVLILLAAAVVIGVLARRRQQLALAMTERQNLDALGKLTGGVAHDFNNLMTIVRQAMSLLRRDPAVTASPSATALVEEADAASEVCGRITTQLLTYARQQRMSTTNIRVANLIDEHRALFQRTLGEHIRLQVGARDPACVIHTDSSQLIAAIMNLLANARDALPAGGAVSIGVRRRENPGRDGRIEALPDGRYVAITIADNGRGMPPEVLRQATTPFFTTKSDAGGSGLGLSTVEGFSRQSGGILLLESTVDIGTVATMLFPAVTE